MKLKKTLTNESLDKLVLIAQKANELNKVNEKVSEVVPILVASLKIAYAHIDELEKTSAITVEDNAELRYALDEKIKQEENATLVLH